MNNNFATVVLKTFGWTIDAQLEYPKKCVICIAPHTSNWDFMAGMLYKFAINLKANFFIKKEWFRFPFTNLMRALGGIPVDRSKKTSLTDQMAEAFSHYEVFRVAIAPEGTRQANPKWKKGLYHIAYKANVPIALAYLDFKKKKIGLGKIFIPSNDSDADMQKIKDFYKIFTAKYPNKFKY